MFRKTEKSIKEYFDSSKKLTTYRINVNCKSRWIITNEITAFWISDGKSLFEIVIEEPYIFDAGYDESGFLYLMKGSNIT